MAIEISRFSPDLTRSHRRRTALVEPHGQALAHGRTTPSRTCPTHYAYPFWPWAQTEIQPEASLSHLFELMTPPSYHRGELVITAMAHIGHNFQYSKHTHDCPNWSLQQSSAQVSAECLLTASVTLYTPKLGSADWITCVVLTMSSTFVH